MDEKTYRLQAAAALSLPASDADKLLALGDGECALLYLHMLRSGGTLMTALAARDLGKSEEAILALADRLRRAGIGSREEAPLPEADSLPEYTAADISRRMQTDGAFRGLLQETQRVLGHALSSADLKTLFGIHDHLGMAPECVMLLINHEAETLRRKYGEGRLPTMHRIEQGAYRWARMEILTAEQAEEYLAREAQRSQELEKARSALNITDRALSPTERNYLESWIGQGFGAEVIALAYDRTVTRTGKLAWAYMNSILRSWAEKGLFTAEAVEKGDAPKGGKGSGRTGPDSASARKVDNTEYLLRTIAEKNSR